ncbi:conserved hypothetical protein [Alkaliphilus metalliredigens QYMF]|uniref:FlgN family protein n=1 Tax=Alkaliphilus metalliredigens (strain QYMF) TaxID=293826 RepID=A6TL83_ALKMQ|nr:flagellar protein FlgN [Alkaliphilus metalliredigens]ABR46951.1 conserved hypothetical protein [Alkaliphilus metalliredigens QYMF]
MSKSIEQLKEALIQENKMYEAVLEMAEEKTEVIVQGQVKELEKITELEQQYMAKMGAFEKVRRSIFANMSEELGIKEPTSVSELLLFLKEPVGEEIDTLRNNLLETIEGLTKVNERNEKLIHQSLEYIHFNLKIMTDSNGDGNEYGHKANEKQKTKTNFFDMRV